MKTWSALLCVIGLSCAAATLSAQWTLDPPGGRQPKAPATPRIAPVPEAQWTDAQKAIATNYVPNGRTDNALRTLLQLPELADGVMPYTTYLLNDSSLPPRQRELLVLRAAWLGGSQTLWATHAAAARNAGMNPAEIRRIAQGPDSAGWDPVEAHLLRLADQLYRNSSVTDATWQALSSGFTMFNMMDAVETVNHFIVLSMI